MVFYKPEFYLIPASKRHLFENKMNSRNDTNPRFLSVKEQSKSFNQINGGFTNQETIQQMKDEVVQKLRQNRIDKNQIHKNDNLAKFMNRLNKDKFAKFESIEESKSVRNMNSRIGGPFFNDKFDSPIRIADMSNSSFALRKRKDTSRLFGKAFFEARNSTSGTKTQINQRVLNRSGNKTELRLYNQNSDFIENKIEGKPPVWNKADEFNKNDSEYPRRNAYSRLEGPNLSIKVDSLKLLDHENSKTPVILQDLTNRNISPIIIGRTNNFSTKSYFNEFRETKKYNSGNQSPSSQKSGNKSPDGYLDLVDAHPKMNIFNIK